MPDLGTKHECLECGAKFYDLGRPDPVCPRCGASQKRLVVDEKPPETAPTSDLEIEETEIETDDDEVLEELHDEEDDLVEEDLLDDED